ncbi:hypothetical protein HPB47_013633 [Ixodes persulcatus]|uniref:Uncharacterized protein n=1 Tax=Ixodes persulcatus TaxID=34615 RepID=A0AC60R0W8_IXOPE|nr:hypothetical protein HPB47_013633 [Ixodes persulcatus]
MNGLTRFPLHHKKNKEVREAETKEGQWTDDEEQDEGTEQRDILDQRDEYVQLQTKMTTSLVEFLQGKGSKHLTERIMKTMGKITNLTIKLLEETAYHRGKVEGLQEALQDLRGENTFLRGELERRSEVNKQKETTTFAEALQRTSQRGTEETSQRDETPTQTNNQRREREGLIIYPKENTNEPIHTVTNMLKSKFTPQELGLTETEIRPVRCGVIVLSSNSEGLQKLQDRLAANPDTTDLFETKMAIRKNPQISIMGVDKAMSDDEMKTKIIEQNNIQGTTDELRTAATFLKEDSKTVIIEVTPAIYRQVQNKQRLYVGWTSCPMRENIHTPRCNTCCKYGHTTRNCRGRPRCSECSGPHPYRQCEGERDSRGHALPNRCPACSDLNEREGRNAPTDHSFFDRSCPALAGEIARARTRINYD